MRVNGTVFHIKQLFFAVFGQHNVCLTDIFSLDAALRKTVTDEMYFECFHLNLITK